MWLHCHVWQRYARILCFLSNPSLRAPQEGTQPLYDSFLIQWGLNKTPQHAQRTRCHCLGCLLCSHSVVQWWDQGMPCLQQVHYLWGHACMQTVAILQPPSHGTWRVWA